MPVSITAYLDAIQIEQEQESAKPSKTQEGSKIGMRPSNQLHNTID